MTAVETHTETSPLTGATTAVRGGMDETVIAKRTGWQAVNLSELWRYRELLFFFTWRDVKVKYKQTALGVAWAVIQPVATMVIFAVVFGRLVGLNRYTGDTPYAIFVFSGLIPWGLFAASMNSAGNSLVAESHIITKIYFPRLIVPIASVGAAVIDFAVASLVLLAAMLACGVVPGIAVLMLPVFLALLLLTALSGGILISALSVSYRDFRYVVPFGIQCLFYLTPVIYPADLIPERFRWLAHVNPMTTVIDGFRYCLIGGTLDWSSVALSAAVSGLLFVASVLYFRRVEATFADVI